MKIFLLLPLLAASLSHAQVDSKGEWNFPTSARTYCINLEQSIVASFKGMIEQNRLIGKQDWTGDKQQAFAISNAMKASIKEDQDSWHKMDCAAILYQKK